MLTVIVKWFSENKGWGFIIPDEGGDDIFVHYSAIETQGFKTLIEGQKVTFELKLGKDGKYQADSVQKSEE